MINYVVKRRNNSLSLGARSSTEFLAPCFPAPSLFAVVVVSTATHDCQHDAAPTKDRKRTPTLENKEDDNTPPWRGGAGWVGVG